MKCKVVDRLSNRRYWSNFLSYELSQAVESCLILMVLQCNQFKVQNEYIFLTRAFRLSVSGFNGPDLLQSFGTESSNINSALYQVSNCED